MPRLAIDMEPRPEVKIWKFIDASIKQLRDSYPELSYKVISNDQEKTLRQYILNAIMVVSAICHVTKPLFNVWHSMIWIAGSPCASFEASDEHSLLAPSVAESMRIPLESEPERLPLTKFELSGHAAKSFEERIELWRQHAEISDEPIERWNEIIVGMIDVHHRLDVIARQNFHLRLRLWKSIEADKRENMLYPGRNVIPDIDFTDFDPMEVEDASSEWDSISTHEYDYEYDSEEDSETFSEDDSDYDCEDDCDSTSEDDTLSTTDYYTDANSWDHSSSFSDHDAESSPGEDSDSAAENEADWTSSDADWTSSDADWTSSDADWTSSDADWTSSDGSED